MKFLSYWLACVFGAFLFGVGFFYYAAEAQNFPGYPPLNYFYVGQGAAGVPQWLAPPSARTSMGLGTIAVQDASAVAITGGTITGLPLPTFPPDAVNKQYVDQNTTGLTVHPSANLATTTALPSNAYSNGASGVGATLTASCMSSCTAPTIDGSAATLGMRIVVKNEVATANNGIYDVTTVGTGSTPFVLTRSADANQPGTLNFNTIGAGTYALVTGGTVNANTGWVVQSQVSSIGISPIIWAQFSASSGVSSINGLQGAFTCAGNVSCAGNAITVPNVAGGYINKFRNGTFDVWQRSTTALTTSVTGRYTADGWIVAQGGASGTCSRQAGHGGPLYALRCIGVTSNTATTIRQPIESTVAAPLASNTVTVQFWYQQTTGGSITPKFSTCFASVQDNFASCTSDIASTSLTSCATATWCLESYTFNVSASAGNGYQVTFDCNTALTAGQYCQIAAADIRVTPNIATGINVNPPPPELRPIAAELANCQRYLYTPSPGWIFSFGGVSSGVGNFASNSLFPVPMRILPTASGSLTFTTGGSFSAGPNLFYLSSTGIGYTAISNTNTNASFFNNSGWVFSAEL